MKNMRNMLYKSTSIFVILMLATTTMASAMIYAPPPTQKVTIQTDNTVYYLGGPVKITVKNGLSQPINFNEIMVKNMKTNVIINTLCSDPVSTCPAIGIIVKLDPGQSYTKTWYPPSKGIYRAYVYWWTEGTVSCMALGCPEPQPGISDTSYSNYFIVR